MTRVSQPPSLESKSHKLEDKDPKVVACSITLKFQKKTLRLLRSEIKLPAGLFNRAVT
jgi:hypothetical protein